MDCSKCERLISEFADKELTGAGEKELKAHLEQCSKCSKLYHLEILTKKSVSSIKLQKAPAGLKDRILAAISSEDEAPAAEEKVIKPPSWIWGAISTRPVVMASSAAAVLLVGVFIFVTVVFSGTSGMTPFISSVYASHNGDGANVMHRGTPSEVEMAVREALARDNIHVASLSAANMHLQGATGDLKMEGRHCVAVKYNGNKGDFSHFVICCMKVPIDELEKVEGNPEFYYHQEGDLTMLFWRCSKTQTTRVLASECGMRELLVVAKQLRMEER